MSAKVNALYATLVIASVGISAEVLGQNSTIVAPGRIEGAGPALSIGVAVAGVVSEILVQEGSAVHSGDTLVRFSCQPLEADLRSREAHLRALQATFDRVKNGPRPDEIRVGEAVVNFSQAKADEAQKTLERSEALQEGVTVSAASILEVRRDARIAVPSWRKRAPGFLCFAPGRARKTFGRRKLRAIRPQPMWRWAGPDWSNVSSGRRSTAECSMFWPIPASTSVRRCRNRFCTSSRTVHCGSAPKSSCTMCRGFAPHRRRASPPRLRLTLQSAPGWLRSAPRPAREALLRLPRMLAIRTSWRSS
jgi:hypothetical protein